MSNRIDKLTNTATHNPTSDPTLGDVAHAAAWHDRLQDTIDGEVDANEQQSIAEHLQNCAQCRAAHRRLLAMDADLRTTFSAAPSLSPDFDRRLLARIDIAEQETRQANRQREEHEHRTRIARLQSDWRHFLRLKLSNLIGIAATVIAAIICFGSAWHGALSNLSDRFTWLPRSATFSLVPILAVFVSMAVAVLAIWLTQRSDRHSNKQLS